MAAKSDELGVRCPRCGEEKPGVRASAAVAVRRWTAPRRVGRSGIVSVLFVDLVGFTSCSDRADPEDVRDALRLYHAEAKQRIELAADRTTTVLSGLPAAPSPAE